MRLSARSLKWLMMFYPPLLFNRIRPVYVAADFQHIRVKIARSWLNRNINGSVFGGTLACAFDPWVGVMYWRILQQLNRPAQIWVKKVELDFRKPGLTALYIDFRITDEDLRATLETLDAEGKSVRAYVAHAINTQGEICATATVHLYIRQTTVQAGLGF